MDSHINTPNLFTEIDYKEYSIGEDYRKERYRLITGLQQYLDMPSEMEVDGLIYIKTPFMREFRHDGDKKLLAIYTLKK